MPDGTRVQEGQIVVLRVTLGRESDVQRWCTQLHCTETQLQRAIKAVGNNPSQVEEHLVRKYGLQGS